MKYANFNAFLGRKSMKTINLTFVILISITLFGCGPEKSQLDLERENKAERTNQKAQENARLVGTYEGQLMYGDSVLGKLKLEIYPMKVLSSTTEIDPTFVPVLSAFLSGYIPFLEDESGRTTPNGEDNLEVIPTVAYDGRSEIILEGVPVGSKYKASVNGTFNGTDTIEGTYFAVGGLRLKGIGTVVSAKIVFKKK